MSIVDLTYQCVYDNLLIQQGSTWIKRITKIEKADGTFADLTGFSFRGQARKDYDQDTPVAFSFSFERDLTTSPHSVVVSVSASVTDALVLSRRKNTVFVYDFELVDLDGNPFRFREGRVSVARNITRDANPAIGFAAIGSTFVVG